jgi:hypothetical protein
MAAPTCTCDKCSEEFSIEIQNKVVEFNSNKYIINYFVCPNCKESYIICLDNKKIIDLKSILEQKQKALLLFGNSSTKIRNFEIQIQNVKQSILLEYCKLNKVLKKNMESCLLLIRQ